MKIFVGSSSEAKIIDTEIRKILEDHHETIPIPWRNIFTPGEFGLESLQKVKNEVDGAILITTSDDKTWYRGAEGFAPRDNVLFELGFFISALGRGRVGLIVVKNKKGNIPKIPTDLAGLNYIFYEQGKVATNESAITKWLFHLQRELGSSGIKGFQNPFKILEEQYPRLPNNWRDDVKNYIIEPFKKQSLDALSGEFSLSISQYYNSLFSALLDSDEENTIVRAISILSSEIWDEDPFQIQYLNYNIQARKKGTSIKRLFVVNKTIDVSLWKTIQNQLNNHIEIRVVNSKVFSKFSNLDDMVIIQKGNDIRTYISQQFFSNFNRIKSANLNLNINYGNELILSFDALWELGKLPSPNFVEKSQNSSEPPGKRLQVYSLEKEVISLEEAAKARGVPLPNELKTTILSTTNGYVAVHLPGDGQISLRAIKNALEVQVALIATAEELYQLELSNGTVSAVLEPVWSMPHLFSKRVLTFDFVTTNNGTRSQYFKFDPIELLNASSYLLGQFEK